MEAARRSGTIISSPTKYGFFKVKDDLSEEVITLEYSVYKDGKGSHIESGDIINYVGYSDECNVFHITEFPIIIVSRTKQSFLNLAYTILKMKEKGFSLRHASCLYDYLDDLISQGRYKKMINDFNINYTPHDLLSYFSYKYEKNKEFVNKVLEDIMFSNTAKLFNNSNTISSLLIGWKMKRDRRMLNCYGITNMEIKQSDTHPFKLYMKIQKNPFTIPTLTIERCKFLDKINCREPHRYDEFCGNILREIYSFRKDKGYSCVTLQSLYRRHGDISNYKFHLENEFKIVFEEIDCYKDETEEVTTITHVYENKSCKIENDLVKFIEELMTGSQINNVDVTFSDERLDKDQREAIIMALNNNISIITGPAGSGKTTTVQELVANCEKNNIKYMVCSFTGKAVIRAKELNGLTNNSNTIHKSLTPNSEIDMFELLIVDEASMLNCELFWRLIKKFTHRFAVVFIGDIQQIPPIEWGSIFNSLIRSRSVPKVCLSSNHRTHTSTGDENGIIINSTGITMWPDNMPFPFRNTKNFTVIKKSVKYVEDLIKAFTMMPGVTQNDVTILCPYVEKTINGKKVRFIDEINGICQFIWNGKNERIANPNKPDCPFYYLNDRVVLNKNNYDINVFNGQEGTIVRLGKESLSVSFKSTMIVDKGVSIVATQNKFIESEKVIHREPHVNITKDKIIVEKIVTIPMARSRTSDDQDENGDSVSYLDTTLLDLSYAMTIHKSQGSEWENVVLVLPSCTNLKGGFISRNLGYTAITRAQDNLIILDVADKASYVIAAKLPYRCEGLTNKIIKALGKRLYSYEERKIDTNAYKNEDDDMPSDDDDDWD